jgi:hypothetical protein
MNQVTINCGVEQMNSSLIISKFQISVSLFDNMVRAGKK